MGKIIKLGMVFEIGTAPDFGSIEAGQDGALIHFLSTFLHRWLDILSFIVRYFLFSNALYCIRKIF